MVVVIPTMTEVMKEKEEEQQKRKLKLHYGDYLPSSSKRSRRDPDDLQRKRRRARDDNATWPLTRSTRREGKHNVGVGDRVM